LKDDGLICVSVPTHRYMRVFGEEFHRKIGHVREGYTASELVGLFPGLELAGLWYNTGLISQLGCWLYYKHCQKLPGRIRGIVARACRVLFAWADFPNGPTHSCSLCAIFRKRPRLKSTHAI
jgi:hypothetical protein